MKYWTHWSYTISEKKENYKEHLFWRKNVKLFNKWYSNSFKRILIK